MRLIGLHARLHAGKDTAFETIRQVCEQDSLLALRRAFADPLKLSGMRSLGIDTESDPEAVVALANKIKETGRIVVTWDDVSPETGNLIPKVMMVTGREFWQRYGTEAHRAPDLGSSFGPDFWVDNLLPPGKIVNELPQGRGTREYPEFWHNFKEGWAGYADVAVVTDVRFPNEAQRILDLDGEVWKINADERLGPNTDAHPSEQPLPDHLVTRVIDNNHSVAEFQNNLIEALNS